MFWFGLILSLVMTLIGIPPVRNWIYSLFPKISEDQLDNTRIVLILIGAVIAGITHAHQVKEMSDLRSNITLLEEKTKIQTEFFDYHNKDRMVWGKDTNGHIIVFFTISHTPIRETVQLQYHIYKQPPDSYLNVYNILVFRWADSEKKLQEKGFSITYVADPTMKGIRSMISVHDGDVFIKVVSDDGNATPETPFILNESKITMVQ